MLKNTYLYSQVFLFFYCHSDFDILNAINTVIFVHILEMAMQFKLGTSTEIWSENKYALRICIQILIFPQSFYCDQAFAAFVMSKRHLKYLFILSVR